MKKIISIALLAFTLTTSAQTTKNKGDIYVDTKLVNELNCYSFGDMEYRLPYNTEFEKFDQLLVYLFIDYNANDSYSSLLKDHYPFYKTNFIIEKQALKLLYKKGDKLSVSVFEKGNQDMPNSDRDKFNVTRGALAYWNKTLTGAALGGAQKEEAYLKIAFYARTISSYQERYDQYSGTIVKEPIYKETPLTQKITVIKLNNRQALKSNFVPANTKKVDLSASCDMK